MCRREIDHHEKDIIQFCFAKYLILFTKGQLVPENQPGFLSSNSRSYNPSCSPNRSSFLKSLSISIEATKLYYGAYVDRLNHFIIVVKILSMATVNYEVDPDGDCLLILTGWTISKTVEKPEIASEPGGSDNKKARTATIKMRVSSKHLSVASPVFKALFHQGFQEGKTLERTGCLEVKLDDDDPNALLILLRLCHCKFKDVPRKLEVNALKEVARLLDKYFLHDSIPELYVEEWCAALALDHELSEETMTVWACICSVFGRREKLHNLAKRMVLHSTQRIKAIGLPVQGVLGKLLYYRRFATLMLFQILLKARESQV